MLPLALGLLFAATPRVSALDLSTTNATPQLAAFCQERVTRRLRDAGAEVVTSQEIASVLGLERQRQLLGCTDDSQSCMTELAAALGADFLLTGRLARLGDGYELSLGVLDSNTGKTLATAETRAANEAELSQAADDAGTTLALRLGWQKRSVTTPVSWTAVAVGAAVGVFGGVAFGLSQARADQLLRGPTLFDDELVARRVAAEASTLRQLAIGSVIGAGILVVGGVLGLLLPSRPGSATRWRPNGAMLVWNLP